MKYFKVDNRADYAEMFESIPRFSNKKIPRGTSVILEGHLIRPANNGETPFGVVSSYPIMIGNSGMCGRDWGGKYLKDEFGNFIVEEVDWWYIEKMEERMIIKQKGHKTSGLVSGGKIPIGSKIKKVKRKKINPEWDSSKKYVPRFKREEWNMVALIGKVKLRKGQPTAPNWIKLRDISENVEEWLIK